MDVVFHRGDLLLRLSSFFLNNSRLFEIDYCFKASFAHFMLFKLVSCNFQLMRWVFIDDVFHGSCTVPWTLCIFKSEDFLAGVLRMPSTKCTCPRQKFREYLGPRQKFQWTFGIFGGSSCLFSGISGGSAENDILRQRNEWMSFSALPPKGLIFVFKAQWV